MRGTGKHNRIDNGEKSYKRIASITKAIEVLEFLAIQKQPVFSNEIAIAIGEKNDSVLTWLFTLIDKKMVCQVGGGFELGMAAAGLWARKRALLQGQRDQIDRNIKSLGEES